VLEESRCLNGPLHSSGGGSAFLGVVDYADESVDIRPMVPRGNFYSKTVASISFDALFPSDEAAKEGTAGRAGALTRDEGEFGWGGRE
jgi:hypothetical protein